MADETGESRFMARSTTSYDGDLLGLPGGIWAAEDNLVRDVQCKGWVCDCDGVQRGQDQMGRIGKEVLGYDGVSTWK